MGLNLFNWPHNSSNTAYIFNYLFEFEVYIELPIFYSIEKYMLSKHYK